MASVKDKFRLIKAIVLDVDGVLTDGSILVTSTGDENRIMNTKDGFALHHASKIGFPIWVISGGKSPGVGMRLSRLGLKEIHLGIENKLGTLNSLMDKYDLKSHDLLYMGDDLPDLACMNSVGISACPQDAVPAIKAAASYVVPIDGGKGCVRQLIEEVLHTQGKWYVSDAQSQ
jgi:3-deoxy-D-manno-octulosonate 8-phosphate phosphatase (KDO 8-P phosphatase)